MHDEQYAPEEVGEYGLRAHPHLARRARQTLTTVLIGVALAALAVIAALIGDLGYPHLIDDSGQTDARVALWCTLGMLLIVGYHALGWYLAYLEWSGKRDFNLNAFALVSFVIHFLSYVVVVLGMWYALSAMLIAGVDTLAFRLLAVSLLALIAAQIIGATEYLRRAGPAGTLPSHLRELIRFNARRNQPDAPRERSNLDLD